MAAPIISVRNLGKRYELGATLAHDTLRDHLVHAAKSLGGMFRASAPDGGVPARNSNSFWALQDVSFEVEEGEVIGVIGSNGAGKSTLLKILSQITEPTTGEIHIRGRLASLLEVGTGFHGELSGRENIFLNGAILGMSQAEIRAKFDEIVAFAEVEKFLDTPVKRYSTGMYVRLAFAVAAHLEPEILVVDEVLAVGDAAFQAKCLGKMEEVATQQGRTVFFVSHNMSVIQSLCRRVLHLRNGRVLGVGHPDEQIQAYLGNIRQTRNLTGAAVSLGPAFELRRLEFSPTPVMSGAELEFTVEIEARHPVRLLDLVILVYSPFGGRVGILDLRQNHCKPYVLEPGKPLCVTGRVANLPLVEGDYLMGVYVECPEYHRDFYNLATLNVFGRSRREGVVPRNPAYRGSLEFDFEFSHRVVE